MTNSWLLLCISAVYLSLLFAIAHYGDRRARRYGAPQRRPIVYALALSVYCTSWSIYGTAGQVQTTGWLFPPTYVGTIILFLLFHGFLQRLLDRAKRHNITSIADFIASRYGKSQGIAILVTAMAVVCVVPYMALQLKAVSESFTILAGGADGRAGLVDTGFLVALLMGFFAILFGSRPIAPNAPNHGLMLAIGVEAVFKLVALAAVGIYVVFGLFDGIGDLWRQAAAANALPAPESSTRHAYTASMVLGAVVIFCLPRQFHVFAVENVNARDLNEARRLFILYLAIMGAVIWPITVGANLLAPQVAETGYHALVLPLSLGDDALAVIVFLGGLSAATSMVIVSSIALGVMLGNEVATPMFLRRKALADGRRVDLSKDLRIIRRLSISTVLALAYLFYRLLGDSEQLATIGLLSMTLAAQFAPAVIGGLYWRAGHARGAVAGLLAGFALWGYTLLTPLLARIGWVDPTLIEQGLLGISWLRPTALFGMNELDMTAHGLFWSIAVNVSAYIFVSSESPHSIVQRIQADTFAKRRARELSYADMEAIRHGELRDLVARFIGMEAAQNAFQGYYRTLDATPSDQAVADADALGFSERLLAGAIGSASARIVLDMTVRKSGMKMGDVVSFADEASKVFRFNRELLQASMDNVNVGISVVDQSLRLVAWNSAYERIFTYPDGFLYEGRHVHELIAYNAELGECGPGDPETHVRKRLRHLEAGTPYTFQRHRRDGTVLEISGNPIPGGGFVTSYTDITQFKAAESALTEMNENLELRVANRTEALTAAMEQADRANQSKTRFFRGRQP